MDPTGKPFTVEAIDVFTFDANGQNTEHYDVYDNMGAVVQLGMMSMPGMS